MEDSLARDRDNFYFEMTTVLIDNLQSKSISFERVKSIMKILIQYSSNEANNPYLVGVLNSIKTQDVSELSDYIDSYIKYLEDKDR